LFFPLDETSSSYKTIDSDLLKNKKTKEFIEAFGVKNQVLKMKSTIIFCRFIMKMETIDTEPHFKIFFKYWKEEGRPEDFLESN
jgi:hypothetical protein